VFELPEEGSGDPGILIGSTDYSGGLSGTGTSLGEALPNEAADGLDGRTRHVVDATVEGVGSGLLVIDTVWSSKFTGSVESTGTIVGGTGAFEGATGTITESAPEGSNDPSTDEVEAGGPYTIELTVRDADG